MKHHLPGEQKAAVFFQSTLMKQLAKHMGWLFSSSISSTLACTPSSGNVLDMESCLAAAAAATFGSLLHLLLLFLAFNSFPSSPNLQVIMHLSNLINFLGLRAFLGFEAGLEEENKKQKQKQTISRVGEGL
jgi:bacteriorhodopsin